MSQGRRQLDLYLQALLDDRRDAGRLRQLTAMEPVDATHLKIDGRLFVNFCSNNYLGLATHPAVLAAVQSVTRQAGFGSGAAALVSGHTTHHASAERAIARWKNTEAAVLLPSGYQANHAAVQTLAAIGKESGKGIAVRFLVDKLVHASILDAVAASGAAMRIFPHNNLAKLKRLLAESDEATLNVVATESIFSMDGDAADLHGLVGIKAEHPFILLLDEAHASGVCGPDGSGYAHELGLQEHVDVSIVTLSKALGGMGGAVCGSRLFCAGIINFGRAYIYTTNLPAAAAAAAEAAIGVLRAEPQRQARLREIARRVRGDLSAAGISVLPGDSPIICVVTGSESAALAAAGELREEGLLVIPVRPPTVAAGSSRLRVTLCSEHCDDEISRLCAALKRICRPAIGPAPGPDRRGPASG